MTRPEPASARLPASSWAASSASSSRRRFSPAPLSPAPRAASCGHLFGGFKRKDIAELGDLLDEGTAGIVMIGVATPEMGADLYMKRAAKVAKKQVDADAKELKKAIDEAVK